MSQYVSITELKIYKGLDLEDRSDDARIWRAARNASGAFDRWTFRRYSPRVETRLYDHPGGVALPPSSVADLLQGGARQAGVLKLGDDLLEAQKVLTRNGEVEIAADQYLLACGDRYDLQPYDRLVLRAGSGAAFEYSGTPQASTSVTGVWGYHRDYATAWEQTGDTVQNDGGLGEAGTELVVSGAGELDAWGLMPRFQAGQLLRIDDEFLLLRAIDAEADTLTVERGAAGTTAAAHSQGASIRAWRVWDDVWEAVIELAAYLYDLKDSQVYDVTATPETGMMVIPKGVPAQVRLAINAYRRRA